MITQSAASSRPSPLPALTGVRFLAALHVVLFHYAGAALEPAAWWVRAIVACGPTAVSLFYVLSGAVLVYSCTTQAGDLAQSRSAFWRARFARIYPTYLFALVLDGPFFASALLKAHDGAAVAAWGLALGIPVLLLVHGWTALTVFAWNVPGWSLSAEAFFYAIFPSWIGRLRCTSLAGLVRRVAVLYVVALIPPLIVTGLAFWGSASLDVQIPPGPGGVSLQTWVVRFFGFAPIARVPEFLIGICLGHWLRVRHNRLTIPSHIAALLEVGAIGVLVAAWIALGAHPGSKPWLDSGLLAPAFALLIAVLATGSGPLAALLSTRSMVILGDASYALYILQEPVVIWTSKLPGIGLLPTPVSTSIFVLILVGASIACQRLVAEPARLWLLSKRRPAVIDWPPAGASAQA